MRRRRRNPYRLPSNWKEMTREEKRWFLTTVQAQKKKERAADKRWDDFAREVDDNTRRNPERKRLRMLRKMHRGAKRSDWTYVKGKGWQLSAAAKEKVKKFGLLEVALKTHPRTTSRDWAWDKEKKWWNLDHEVGTRLWKEYRDKHPSRNNPVPHSAPSRALLCVGQLRQLEIYDPRTGRSGVFSPKGKWLAWDGKQFQICNVKGQVNASLPSKLVAKHRKFHNANPVGKPFLASMPDRGPTIKNVGLLKSLVYYVPSKIRSPGKNKYLWHHAFGDTGHRGGDSYPTKVMPMLQRDSAGNLFIKRRPGNIFRVDNWLRG